MPIEREAFVTGGAGFIGSHLSRTLLDQGYHVTCYQRADSRSVSGRTVEGLMRSPHFTFIEGDIRDLERLKQEMGTPDVVFHLAAISSVDYSNQHPLETFETNALGSYNVFEAARSHGVPIVLYASTDEVFGPATRGAKHETSPKFPSNPYAVGKSAGEDWANYFRRTRKMDIRVTRAANTYGPHQAPEKFIPKLTVRGLLGNTLPVYGKGDQVREWLYVDDHVRAQLHVVEHGHPGEIYCVGSGKSVKNMAVVEKIVGVLGLDENVIVHVSDRPAHDRRYALDTSKLRKIGWQPQAQFDDALQGTIQWYKDNREWWEPFLEEYSDLEPPPSKMIVPTILVGNFQPVTV